MEVATMKSVRALALQILMLAVLMAYVLYSMLHR
jgi:hypothetical protein